MSIAVAVADRANCKARKVGAILVKDHRIISTGYNGTGVGISNCLDGGCYRCNNLDKFNPGEGYDRCICVHAEANCIAICARFGISTDGAYLYTTTQPCFGCLRDSLQAGIKHIYWKEPWVSSNESYDLLIRNLKTFRRITTLKEADNPIQEVSESNNRRITDDRLRKV